MKARARAKEIKAECTQQWIATQKQFELGDKLNARALLMEAASDCCWAAALMKEYGDATFAWRWTYAAADCDCVLSNGDVYIATNGG
jgi:hypothetical protein